MLDTITGMLGCGLSAMSTLVVCDKVSLSQKVYDGLRKRFEDLEKKDPNTYPKNSLTDLLLLSNGAKTIQERTHVLACVGRKATMTVATAILERGLPLSADYLFFITFPEDYRTFTQWIGRTL